MTTTWHSLQMKFLILFVKLEEGKVLAIAFCMCMYSVHLFFGYVV